MSIDDKHPTEYFGPGAKVTFRGPHGTPITVDQKTWDGLQRSGAVTMADVLTSEIHTGRMILDKDGIRPKDHPVLVTAPPDACPAHRTDVTRAELKEVFAAVDAARENVRAWRGFAILLFLVLAAAFIIGILR